MATPEQEIDSDLLRAFVVEAKAYESHILGYADGLVESGATTLADALAKGFKAQVPLAGGMIAAAITTALQSMDVTADTKLKTLYDGVIAKAEAGELS